MLTHDQPGKGRPGFKAEVDRILGEKADLQGNRPRAIHQAGLKQADLVQHMDTLVPAFAWLERSLNTGKHSASTPTLRK